jgi:predicted CopG family antitoxin
MSELKTKPGNGSVEALIRSILPESKRSDCEAVLEVFNRISGIKPVLWGDAIIGYGQRHFKYESGREGDWFICGFSPRKANIVIYLLTDIQIEDDLYQKLGKHKRGRSCIYINKLTDIHIPTLEAILKMCFNQ